MNAIKYSIKNLERLTGIKAHTIRMWEKRYGIIKPERTETNIRFYNDADLQKLLNISILNKNGHKISHISAMASEEIVLAVSGLSASNEIVDADINSMIVAALDLQEEQFEVVLNSCLIKLGFERTFCDVIFPLLEKLGIMWQIGRISACQERFITNLIRQKLLVAIDGITGAGVDLKGTFLMLMPIGHDKDIGLLFANYLARKNGYKVVYLGSSVPIEHLRSLDVPERFSQLFISLSLPVSLPEISSYLKQLREVFPKQAIHIANPFGVDYSCTDDNATLYLDYLSFIKLISS
ncbi:MAG: MerR family transcriptional regulator [Bacteroidales bacterium]|nr:MerR family transcriptional regulator [Bacteroidales bacterium]